MIYLLRHGETVWNTEGRFQGQKDSPLTSRGRNQAEAMGEILAAELGAIVEPVLAYVSPLGRAQETAALINRYVPLSIVSEPRIQEVSVGSWDGLTQFEIENEYPRALDGTDHFDWYFKSRDGESLAVALRRVESWLQGARRPAIAISHGLCGRLIRGAYLGLSRREMLRLPVPQDGFFKLNAGRVEFVGRGM